MSGKKVAIIMGSTSDADVGAKAEAVFKDFGVEYEILVMSAHRTPNKVRNFALHAQERGFGVIIAIAGLAAHLPGVIAGQTLLPVIGVPAAGGPLNGNDALLSIVQMPPGIPVACMGIGNAKNAALFAVQILSRDSNDLLQALRTYRRHYGDDSA